MTTMASTATAAGLPGGPISMVAAGVMHEEEVGSSRAALQMSPRQQVLDKYWSFYRTDQYAARTVAWDGSRYLGMVERDSVALQGFVPPGFYIAGPTTLPVALRRPTTPYHVVKVIVDRFTSMLFSNKRHPKISVSGDPKTEDFLNTVAEVGRLWPTMMLARSIGGGMGSTIVGFKLINGRPAFEVFDPRWARPTFLDRSQLVLDRIDYRYVFTREVKDLQGQWHEVAYWYRRVIDRESDVVFRPVPVPEPEDDAPPRWEPAAVVKHGLGFCPVVWIQNTPNPTDLDGDPDCMGCLDLAEAIDRLNSQSDKGIIATCDPTVVVSDEKDMGSVAIGVGTAIKLGQGGDAKYMEMTGSGIDMARKKIEDYKAMICEVTGCVLALPDRQMTATEVERLMSPMIARADSLREQYGEQGVKKLLNMICVAAKRIGRPVQTASGIVRRTIVLPDKVEVDDASGEVRRRTPRQIGDGPYSQIDLSWPAYYEPGAQDAGYAVTAATTAKHATLIDRATAARYLAGFFGVEDVNSMLENIRRETIADQMELERQAVTGPTDDPSAPGAEDAKVDSANVQQSALNGAQITALVELAQAVKAGQLDVQSALAIIEISFPVSQRDAMRIVGNLKPMPQPALAPAAPSAPPPAATPPVSPPAGAPPGGPGAT